MWQQIQEYLYTNLDRYLKDLEEIANLDSGTCDKAAVDEVGRRIAHKLSKGLWHVETIPNTAVGDCVYATLLGSGKGCVLLLGHLDTVFPLGTAKSRPVRVEEGRLLGPGTADMKAGLVSGLWSVQALQSLGWTDFERIGFLFTTDEENGSPVCAPLVSRLCCEYDLVLVLEAGRENGDLITERKGGGKIEITVRGRAAHAGERPEEGANAVLQLAQQLVGIAGLGDLDKGTTVNIGTFVGGSQFNVVPDIARADVDVRARSQEALDALIGRILECCETVYVEGTTTNVSFACRPVMTQVVPDAFLDGFLGMAREMGVRLRRAAMTGGTSDANFVAEQGIPVLDSLGPVGGDDHTDSEYVLIESIVPRATLLAMAIVAGASGLKRNNVIFG